MPSAGRSGRNSCAPFPRRRSRQPMRRAPAPLDLPQRPVRRPRVASRAKEAPMPAKAAAILLFLLPFAAGAARAETLTVGAAGADYSSIQAAVDAAPEGATIIANPGRYAETVEIAKPL